MEKINNQILDLIPERTYKYLSSDSVEDKELVDKSLYPIEFLNTLTSSRMSPHKLVLKKEILIVFYII